jgi:uridine phosphorylase
MMEMDPVVVKKLETVLLRKKANFMLGKTWTMDAFYRETPKKIANRKREGCLTEEMECSALIVAAKFLGVAFGQYLIASDDVSGESWNPRKTSDDLKLERDYFGLP